MQQGERHRVIVVLLDLPKLFLERRKLSPGALRNIQRASVVARLSGSHTIFLQNSARSCFGG